MTFPRIRAALISLSLATSLAACAHSEPPPVLGTAAPDDIRVTLPASPQDVAPCLKRAFPDVPDRDLSTADVVRIIGQAKVLDRAKSRCGLRAVDWINAVRRDFAH